MEPHKDGINKEVSSTASDLLSALIGCICLLTAACQSFLKES